MPGPPEALNTDQLFYAHHSEQLGRIADAITEQNELLRQVLIARPADQPDATDELASAGPVAVKLREPEPANSGVGAVELREPEPTPEPKPVRPARGGRRTTKAST